ncbi:hypothetical protein [Candidatus Nanosynbacter sp. TM7-053]|uniref:hypothetical protein n=1 Tax=Candidatus Nanosynbacter sp. TM7-053 TaxID=2902634 RepID=UPI001FB7B93B|nr:hypothetical protein [Candidatus Nanosynbacter sp. TM7-053]MCJ1965964.1 hypothetical protein [Candidatus Nanosynbacter sp. TM7-053]
MPCIDCLPGGTNTNSQRVILNDNLDGFGTYGEASKVGDEELENDTTKSSQNSYPDVLDDYYSDLEALTKAADNKKTKEEMARLATGCAGLYPIEECNTETGIVF